MGWIGRVDQLQSRKFAVSLILIALATSASGCAKAAFGSADSGSSGVQFVSGQPAPNPLPGSGPSPGPSPGPGPGSMPNPDPTYSELKDQTVVTQLDTAVSFVASLAADNGLEKKLVFPGNKFSFVSPNGLLEIVDATTLEYQYTPNDGFRGTDIMTIYMLDSNGSLSQATLTMDVANALTTIQPALATRTTGCIMCHANISSNIITDFGYGGDGSGLNYFFGGVPGVLPPTLFNAHYTTNESNGSMYGDYDLSAEVKGVSVASWASATLTGTTVVVPQAPTTDLPTSQVPEATLAAYLTYTLSHSLVTVSQKMKVQEVSSMYIGAPTAARILEVAGLNAPATIKYIPETASSPPFSGIQMDPTSSYYTNTGPIVCDGDLVIDGILWLNLAEFSTDTGCRLYVTNSVFITGTLTLTSENDSRNVQISSGEAVLLGLGHNTCLSQTETPDSIVERLEYASDPRFAGAFTRFLGTPQNMLSKLLEEANTVRVLVDAVCGPNGRTVAFERLLLNAPVVESRYQGAFSGVVISEITLTSLESLDYHFDPVFSNVTILPLLKPSDYLTISQ